MNDRALWSRGLRFGARCFPGGRTWLNRRELEAAYRAQVQPFKVDWGSSQISVLVTKGLGDLMIARQFAMALERLRGNSGLPSLGKVVISAGAWPTDLALPDADLHIYWWWSMGGRQDWLAHYLSTVSHRPDLILCPSPRCLEAAHHFRVDALYLTLAAGLEFRPLHSDRTGIGYAGSRGHKDANQTRVIIEPVADRPDFEWVDDLNTPSQLNAFYNRKSVVLGMTERIQADWGMVNNRVFEVLATDTPFVVHRHDALAEILDFQYPGQVSTADETRTRINDFVHDRNLDTSIFQSFGRAVREHHSYSARIATLLNRLSSI